MDFPLVVVQLVLDTLQLKMVMAVHQLLLTHMHPAGQTCPILQLHPVITVITHRADSDPEETVSRTQITAAAAVTATNLDKTIKNSRSGLFFYSKFSSDIRSVSYDKKHEKISGVVLFQMDPARPDLRAAHVVLAVAE